MRNLDFSSWNSLLTTVLGLVLVSVVAVGIRLVFMQTIQRRRERENRQINERLRTLIAAYKTLGGSFTGNLVVDPAHLRDARRAPRPQRRDDLDDLDHASDVDALEVGSATPAADETGHPASATVRGAGGEALSERRRRTRDAVEAALSDIVLLGTEEHVVLAVHAAQEMVSGRPVQVKDLVVSLRDFIRQALDLEPIPAGLRVPDQGPLRPGSGGGRGAGGAGGSGAAGGRGGAGGGAGAGMGAGMGMGAGAGGLAVAQRAEAGDVTADPAAGSVR